MTAVTATELASHLGVSKGRVSQMVSAGQLDGCYSGDGRSRRFDLAKVKAALGQRLDPGQMLGNGAATSQALKDLPDSLNDQCEPRLPMSGFGATPIKDDDGYHMARTQKAVEEARKLRRQNAEADGEYVLASEVTLEVRKLIGQEIAEFEQVLRKGARAVADECGVDFKLVRALLLQGWRDHRELRAQQIAKKAEGAELSETEKEQDI